MHPVRAIVVLLSGLLLAACSALPPESMATPTFMAINSPTATYTHTPTSTPTLKQTPTATSKPSNTPRPTKTPAPPTVTKQPDYTPIPLPEPDVKCSQLSSGFYECSDTLLQIEFEYPRSWGTIVPRLSRGETGQAYEYDFGITAGGRSSDFSMGRGGTRTDFKGFSKISYEDICRIHNAAFCQSVKPDVIVMVLLPTAEDICAPAPGKTFRPEFIIMVDLPTNNWINGFLFSSNFTSYQLQSTLNSILDLNDPIAKCSEGVRQQYNDAIQQIDAGLRTGLLDEGTLQNLNMLWHVAESIKFH